ncbi:MAG: DNA repair protein RecN [Acutalibacteraceae bacterium]|nr:DNA repair protein RecN [Acutalibacteraceae bacterium]
MLKFLHIENIAVIEQSDIEFKNGFNVLTGETGAGKSIVIDAINAVLGERTSKDLIRNGCENAVVSAVFGELDDTVSEKLKEYGIIPDEDGNIIITRKLSLTGKGYIKINNIPFTAGVLKEIGKLLLNIHGQHDNQALLDPEKHLLFVDAVADNKVFLEEYYKEFKNLNSIRKELQSLEIDDDQKQRKIDLLKYQINEIESANITVGEYDELKKKLEIADSFEKTYKAYNNSDTLLNGNEDNDGAVTLIQNAIKLLNSVNANTDKLNEALVILEDAKSEISHFLGNQEFLNVNPDEINQRLDLITRLMLKYGSGEEEILQFSENAQTELANISFSEKRIAELSEQLDLSTNRLIELAEKLTASRKSSAEKFQKNVTDVLKYLNMPNVKFFVDFKKGRYTKIGCDVCEFMISANDGETPKPLHKIASGGELSRVMLSIKSVLLDKDTVGTMIFDEIDTGISGFAAGKVGTQLKKVASSRQVICVTHLAQIAAMADEHLLIEKSVRNGRTYTKVNSLDYQQRISEIARIMSGTELTENLYNSAKELIDRSNIYENL